jgi:CheY-specific phosphatase CheX
MATQRTPTTKPELAAIVAEVLGDLAFLIADTAPPAETTGTIWLQGDVRYDGAESGRLTCWCTRQFAIQLAANLLGTDPDDAEALTDAEDALQELLNVLCGNLVTAWYGDTAVFNLSIPSVKECIDAPEATADDAQQACWLSVSDEPVLVVHTQG